jgi:hypothetical protein
MTATAGPRDCSGTGSGTVTVTVNQKPTVEVAAANSPVTICETYAPNHVDMTFEVTARPRNGLTLPPTITASDGRQCTLSDTSSGEW